MLLYIQVILIVREVEIPELCLSYLCNVVSENPLEFQRPILWYRYTFVDAVMVGAG